MLEEEPSLDEVESEPYFHRSDRNDIDNPWGGMLVGVAILIGVVLSLYWLLFSSN